MRSRRPGRRDDRIRSSGAKVALSQGRRNATSRRRGANRRRASRRSRARRNQFCLHGRLRPVRRRRDPKDEDQKCSTLQRDVTGLACRRKAHMLELACWATKAEALIVRANDTVTARGYCRLGALSSPAMSVVDRVEERRRAAALARHYRDHEALSTAEIARRLGRAPATVKAYLYDPSYANKRPTDSPQDR